jgi:hypothetical protein
MKNIIYIYIYIYVPRTVCSISFLFSLPRARAAGAEDGRMLCYDQYNSTTYYYSTTILYYTFERETVCKGEEEVGEKEGERERKEVQVGREGGEGGREKGGRDEKETETRERERRERERERERESERVRDSVGNNNTCRRRPCAT